MLLSDFAYDLPPERIAAVVAAIGAQGGLAATRTAVGEYVTRAKAALTPLGNLPARAEFVAIADALLA